MDTVITLDDVSPQYVSSQKLEILLNFLGDINVLSTLFVIPNSDGLFSLDEKFVKVLRVGMNSGHEMALHGYKHTKNEFGYILPCPFPRYDKQKELIEKGKNCLRKVLGEDPLGFRAPSYRFNRATLRALANLNFLYDSSKTVFKPTYNIRFRIKTFNSPKIYRMQGLREIPVTGDYTYIFKRFGFLNALRRALDDFLWVKHQDGVFVLNSHVQHLDKAGFAFLNEIVKKLTGKTNFVRLIDLVL